MNKAKEHVINVSLFKGFLNRTHMNECGQLGWTLFVSKDVFSSNNLNIP